MAVDTVPHKRDATAPRSSLSGPYGHPFHPILVTIPIGAWIASLLFDIATRVADGGSHSLAEGAFWLIGLGVVGALLAAVFGLLDLLTIPPGTKAMRVGLTHMVINVSVVALFGINFFLRSDGYDTATEATTGQLVLSVVAIALLAVSGWLGGQLAYRYGVRVAREEDQAEGYLSDARR